MPVSFTYDAERQVLIAKISGSMSLEEMRDSVPKLTGSQEYPPDVNTLWDLSEMEFHNIDYQFNEKLIDIRKTIADKRREAKVALLLVNQLARPVVELFRIMSEGLPQQTQIFTRREEAMKWLCDDVDEVLSGR